VHQKPNRSKKNKKLFFAPLFFALLVNFAPLSLLIGIERFNGWEFSPITLQPPIPWPPRSRHQCSAGNVGVVNVITEVVGVITCVACAVTN
jgi:hypothetical protein